MLAGRNPDRRRESRLRTFSLFWWGLPVLLAGDLNPQNVDWNSRLTRRRGKLLRDYADENSCLIFGPDTPTTNPYSPSATPDVLDIAVSKDVPLHVYLTSCCVLSSDHLPVLIDTACRSSFHHPPDRLISGALIGPISRFTWKIIFRSIRNGTMGWQLTHALRTSPAPFCRLWRHLLRNVAHVTTHSLQYRPAFRMKYAWRTGCGGVGRSPETPRWKPRSCACSGLWPAGSMSGGTTSGVRHSNPSIPKTNRCGGWPSE